jgi:(1->4)-alpha-D-glucan 1-alpha-D-glucosylmutase
MQMTPYDTQAVLPSPPPGAGEFRDYLTAHARVPVSTYRLQFTPTFTFDHASEVLPYLTKLGVTDLYCSPLFRAKPGSTHGYDVCDFARLNPELGGDEAFACLAGAVRANGLGLMEDFVPNHMAAEPELNPWSWDVLEHGPASPFAKFFDVDWNPVKPELRGKVLIPFLGDNYGRVLERGELSVAFQAGGFVIRYFERPRPVDPRQYPRILRIGLDELRAELGDDPQLAELLSIITALDHIPRTSDTDPDRIAERLRESRLAKERLARLADAAPRIRKHIDDALRVINGTPGKPESFDALHELLEALPYRLANWKTAVHEINYRRFFDINQLLGLRVEEPAAFQAMHQLLLKLIGDGIVTGVRLDHIDGLFDPAGYLNRLQSAVFTERVTRFVTERNRTADAPQFLDWGHAEELVEPNGLAAKPLYAVVEKILSGTETLPAWRADGTTGYDFMNDVSRLFVNPRNAPGMRNFYRAFTGLTDPFPDVVYDCKKLITWTALASELNVLAHALNRMSERDRNARDFTLDSLREALREVAVCFPVYRTYVGPGGASDADRHVIDLAILRARGRNPAMEASVFDFVRAALLPEREANSEDAYQARLKFAMKFQQYTGPLQAKGVEDTAFYRYNVLVSLNEVGGDPQRFGGTVAQFHQANQHRRDHSPHGLLATATHDTKRGEDARCRIHVLSEVPRMWRKKVSQWAEINAACRSLVDGSDAPDRNDEYLFYQALIGCWPAGAAEPVSPPDVVSRLRDYMLKAIKEAKAHTSWIAPNEAYDRAVAKYVEDALAGPQSREFLRRFLPFQRRVARAGMLNSLSQLVLKLASPGAPDFYQGTELWDLSLVDPDNRRAVDHAARARMLDELESWLAEPAPADLPSAASEWLNRWEDGRIKLYVTARGLRLRKQFPDLFLDGEYIPLSAAGEFADHVVAFARRLGEQVLVVVIPRLCVALPGHRRTFPLGADVWRETRLVLPPDISAARLRNVLTQEAFATEQNADGATVPLAELFRALPVAMCLVES